MKKSLVFVAIVLGAVSLYYDIKTEVSLVRYLLAS